MDKTTQLYENVLDQTFIPQYILFYFKSRSAKGLRKIINSLHL